MWESLNENQQERRDLLLSLRLRLAVEKANPMKHSLEPDKQLVQGLKQATRSTRSIAGCCSGRLPCYFPASRLAFTGQILSPRTIEIVADGLVPWSGVQL